MVKRLALSLGEASADAAILEYVTGNTTLRHQDSRPHVMAQVDMDPVDRQGEVEESSLIGGQEKLGEQEKGFSEVRAKRKRKTRATEMEVEDASLESVPKRPSFPPVDASTMLVCLLPLWGACQGFVSCPWGRGGGGHSHRLYKVTIVSAVVNGPSCSKGAANSQSGSKSTTEMWPTVQN